MVKRRTPNEMQRKAFGALIQRARKGRGFTQEALAEYVDCGAHWINQIERGKSNPNWLDACRLAVILELEPEEILESVEARVPY